MERVLHRQLPSYTPKEERINTVTHIIGAAFGVVFFILAIALGIAHRNIWSVASGAVYGICVVGLFCVSSIYHGLQPSLRKAVMRVVDHCTIYLMICGTYTPILLVRIRPEQPVIAWVVFGVQWALAAIAVFLNTMDLKKFRVLSMVLYIAMGWCIIFVLQPTIATIGWPAFWWLLAGGICYTVGAVLYGIGKKKRYFHSAFHLFVNLGSLLQAVCILGYVL